MSKKVSMRDLAAQLNISAVSVSKALSGKEGISEELRQIIVDKAIEMGYEYKPLHMNLVSAKRIGVLVSQTFISDSSFYAQIYKTLALELGKRGHICTLEILNHRDETMGNLPLSIDNDDYDGLFVLGTLSESCMDKALHLEIPVVFVDNYTVENDVDCVVSDSVYGSHMLTNYLIKKGLKKIAFVGTVTATNSIMDRYLGYLKALLQNDIPAREEYVLPDRDISGYLTDISIPKDLPEAFVCNCDETAFHLIKQLDSLGIKVPKDVSVVGFDDYLYATLATPKLTTFKVDINEMCEVATNLLEDKLKNPSISHGRKVVSGKLVLRDSVRE